MKRVFKKLFKIIEVGDLVRINSNCPNVRKPVYKIYGILQTKKGKKYILVNTYKKELHTHFFTKEELFEVLV